MTLRSARGRRIALAVAVLVLVSAVLAGCSETAKNNRQNSLEPKGPAAQTIDNLFMPVAVIAILVGIFILVATVFVAIKFRHRPGNENPKQVHGNTPLEIGWTIVPALILAIIAVPSVATIFKLAENPGPKVLQVTVVGKQWWWEFHYPDAKVVTADELIIPAGRPVYLHLTACAETIGGCNVIHSFWVPELAGKKDVVPGHDNTLTIEADKPGTYLGQCAEYCGLSHANMRFRVIAKTADDFDAWLAEQQQGPAQPLTVERPTPTATKQEPAGEAQDLMINTFGCTNCHMFDDSSKPSYGPNLTHLASRTTFASGVVRAEPARTSSTGCSTRRP